MPLRSDDLGHPSPDGYGGASDDGPPERPSTLIHREARENLEQRLMRIAKIGAIPLPPRARMAAHWILGFAYNALAGFHYPSLGPPPMAAPRLEGLRWWVSRLPESALPDPETRRALENSSVRTVVELIVFRARDGSEHACVHYHPLLSLEEAAGFLRAFLGARRSADA